MLDIENTTKTDLNATSKPTENSVQSQEPFAPNLITSLSNSKIIDSILKSGKTNKRKPRVNLSKALKKSTPNTS